MDAIGHRLAWEVGRRASTERRGEHERRGTRQAPRLVAKAGAGTHCDEEDALWTDSKATRVRKHRVGAAAVRAAANPRAGQHGEHTVLEDANAVVSGVCNVDASVSRNSDAARVEEGGRRRVAQQLLG